MWKLLKVRNKNTRMWAQNYRELPPALQFIVSLTQTLERFLAFELCLNMKFLVFNCDKTECHFHYSNLIRHFLCIAIKVQFHNEVIRKFNPLNGKSLNPSGLSKYIKVEIVFKRNS